MYTIRLQENSAVFAEAIQRPNLFNQVIDAALHKVYLRNLLLSPGALGLDFADVQP